jgi:hypothetical protein
MRITFNKNSVIVHDPINPFLVRHLFKMCEIHFNCKKKYLMMDFEQAQAENASLLIRKSTKEDRKRQRALEELAKQTQELDMNY